MGRRLGCQEPTFTTVGDWQTSSGPEAVSLFESYGVEFYPCQRDEMDVFLARSGGGRFASRTIAISKPRQNGKSYAARFYAIWMAVVEGKSVLFSAHHGKTVRKMFKAICDFVTAHGDFSRCLRPRGQGIYKAAGSEGLYFVDDFGEPGGMIEFQTRTSSGGRGETYDVIVIDEAQELTQEQLDAIKPTTIASESGDPQMIYLGTPPNAKCQGTVFADFHTRAHEGSEAVWWSEWAAEGIPDMTDREGVLDLAYRCNPAMGYRIQEDVMLDAIDTTAADSFAREYLGWWAKASNANPALSPSKWRACATAAPPDPSEDDLIAYGVKFSADGLSYSLSAAVRAPGHPVFIECIEVGTTSGGVSALARWLAERGDACARCVIDGKSHGETLRKKLVDGGFPERAVTDMTPGNVCAAASMLKDAVDECAVAHAGQPGLTESAEAAQKRAIGKNGSWGFGDGAVPCGPIESASLAYWGVVTTKRKPGRKARAL